MAGDRLVPIGKVVRTHGIRGHLKVIPYGETLAATATGTSLVAVLPDGVRHELTVAAIAPLRGGLRVLFRECTSVETASGLVGAEITIPESRLPPVEEDEYYWYQLIGLAVEDPRGRSLGTLVQILETGSNDVYVVRKDNEEILVPATQDVVIAVDLEQGKMVVDLPPLV